MAKIKAKAKEQIRLRQRAMASGRVSLYLDVYVNGVRSYEYLHLYLIPENTKADREANKATLELAEAIQAKRVVELRNGQYGFRSKSERVNFYDYYTELMNERVKKDSTGNTGNWASALHHLQVYDKHLKRLTLEDITPQWVMGFKNYLSNEAVRWAGKGRTAYTTERIKHNTAQSYFRKLKALLNEAYDQGLITKNPAKGIKGMAGEEVPRAFLTTDEVRVLMETPCRNEGIKRAFLFSCFTGLRRSDILKLTWGEVQEHGTRTRLVFRQKKTGGQEYLDIPDEAVKYLGERGKASDHPFILPYPTNTNSCLTQWVMMAGIRKTITFHCGRHTFACMMIDLGADLYVVSKLLGHKEIKTTQIYAKIMDKNKQDAVKKLDDFFGCKQKKG